MGRIEKYIDKIYSGVNESDEETKILKEEMKLHLYDKVKDLMEEGLTEEDSITVALETFGDEVSVSKDVKSIVKNQKKYTNILIRISIILFIVGSLFKVSAFFAENKFIDDFNKTRETTSSDVLNGILDVLNKAEITEQDKKGFDSILNDYNNKYENGLYSITILKDNIPLYEFNREVSPDLIKNDLSGMTSKGHNWTVHYKQTDYDSYRNSIITSQIFSISDISNSLHFILNNIGFLFISLSWILTVMYYTQKSILNNSLDKKKIILLSIESIIIFATFVSDKDIMMPTVLLFIILNYFAPKVLSKYFNKSLSFV